MTCGCVIDAELFRKYCGNKCKSIYEATRCLINQGFDGYVIEECHCVLAFLDLIKQGKCKLYYSKEINKEYLKYVEELPEDILNHLLFILSNTNFSEKIQTGDGGFEKADFDEIKLTDIEHKTIYLDVAKALDDRKIVSSKDDIISCYDVHKKILLSHTIFYRNVCEQLKELKDAQ